MRTGWRHFDEKVCTQHTDINQSERLFRLQQHSFPAQEVSTLHIRYSVKLLYHWRRAYDQPLVESQTDQGTSHRIHKTTALKSNSGKTWHMKLHNTWLNKSNWTAYLGKRNLQQTSSHMFGSAWNRNLLLSPRAASMGFLWEAETDAEGRAVRRRSA